MTTQEQKALELALDALKSIKWVNSFNEGDYLTCNFKSVETSITAIKEALAQPERHELQAKGEHPAPCARFCEANAFNIEIRRMKAQRKPLTDEELYKVFPAIATYTELNKTLYRSIARAIEAAHGIKE